MRFSVCIGTVRPTTLTAVVDAVRRQTWLDWELIAVGQGTDVVLRSAGEAAAAADARIRYVHLRDKGVSHARNIAISICRGDVIAITDDDCEPRADWLATLAECFSSEPTVDLVGGALIAPNSNGKRLARCPQYAPPESLYDPMASGRVPPSRWSWLTANVAFRRPVFDRAGPFDEAFGPGAIFRVVTDLEYQLRLESLGVRMRSTPRAVVFHTHGYRYGFRALARHTVDYAWGHGALAAKLTLSGDPRGRAWLAATRQRCLSGWVRERRPAALAANTVRLWWFTRGYRYCLRHYRVDARGVLERFEKSPRSRRTAVTDV